MFKLSTETDRKRKKWQWTPLNEARARDVLQIINEYEPYWPLTVRQVYYRLISSGLTQGGHWHRNGNPEHPPVDIYQSLDRLLKWLRIHERIEWRSITDEHRILSLKQGYEDVDHFINEEMQYFLSGYKRCTAARQDYYLETWIEKAALYHIIKPISDEFCRRTVVCKGYSSISFQADFYTRASEALMRGQKPVILYFGDWDPSGVDMPYSIMKTLQDDLGLTNFEVYRCGINPDHFDALDASPVPVKRSDNRAKKFIKAHGETCYELDAFHPRELQALVRNSLRTFTDMTQMEKDLEIQKEDETVIDAIYGNVHNLIINLACRKFPQNGDGEVVKANE